MTSTPTVLGATGREQSVEAIDCRDEGALKHRCAPRLSLGQGPSGSR